MSRRPLGARARTGGPAGSTAPARAEWTPPPGRSYEGSTAIGSGDADFAAAAEAVLRWGVKTRSGFAVQPENSVGPTVARGDRWWLIARFGPFRVREPVEVVAVVQEPDRVGFAYATLEGHPIAGEEAFVVSRAGDTVLLTLRSVTRAGRRGWRLAFPALLVAQRIYRARYRRALRHG